jgi:hypothetical protein
LHFKLEFSNDYIFANPPLMRLSPGGADFGLNHQWYLQGDGGGGGGGHSLANLALQAV